MVTTIQIRENVKHELDRLKESEKETYEEVILNLMKIVEKYKRKQKKFLVEGYMEMAVESSKVTKDWLIVDRDWD